MAKNIENQFIVDWKILTKEELSKIYRTEEKIKIEKTIVPGTFKGYEPINKVYSDPAENIYFKL